MQALRRLTFDGFETMTTPTPDELVAQAAALFEALHAAVEAHEDGPLKRYAAKRVNAAHALLEDVHEKASAGGVSIMSPIPKPQ